MAFEAFGKPNVISYITLKSRYSIIAQYKPGKYCHISAKSVAKWFKWQKLMKNMAEKCRKNVDFLSSKMQYRFDKITKVLENEIGGWVEHPSDDNRWQHLNSRVSSTMDRPKSNGGKMTRFLFYSKNTLGWCVTYDQSWRQSNSIAHP